MIGQSGSKRESLRDKAYKEIKRRITTIIYKPGEYLNEALICEHLNIGKTPVHGAIEQLALEGLVEVIPRKGLIVKPISMDELQQITEVRIILEGHAASLAAEHASETAISEMEELIAKAADLTEKQEIEGLMNLDRQFHQRIARAAHNQILIDLLGLLHDRALRFWFVSLGHREHLEQIAKEHKAILDAIKCRDQDRARQAIVAHINSSRRNIMKSG